MNNKTNAYLGKKILYTLVIALSGLLVLLSITGIIGVWLVESPLSEAAVKILTVVENSTEIVRTSSARVDRSLATLQVEITEVINATRQLSQNVTDEGLVIVLLPEEQEQRLAETSDSVLDTYNEIGGSITNVVGLYRSINHLPFVNLPGLNENQIEQIESASASTRALVNTLRSEIMDFRAGVTSAIEKVEDTANLLNDEIVQVRDALSQLDSNLAALEAFLVRLQQIISAILVTFAVLLSLILAFLIFTQVEVIRLYINRWRLLGNSQGGSPTDTLTQSNQEESASPESE